MDAAAGEYDDDGSASTDVLHGDLLHAPMVVARTESVDGNRKWYLSLSLSLSDSL